MLQEGLVTPEDVARLPASTYLDLLFSDKGCQMLREHKITLENAEKMKFHELKILIESYELINKLHP